MSNENVFSASSSFEGPATTDAALAALAAEAGLIVPESDKQSDGKESDLVSGDSMMPEDASTASVIGLSDNADMPEASVSGLLGGRPYTKLSLKGGSVLPPKGYKFSKLGLKGGSKDEDCIKSPTTTAEADSTQSVNGLVKPKEEAGDGK